MFINLIAEKSRNKRRIGEYMKDNNNLSIIDIIIIVIASVITSYITLTFFC